MRISKIALVVGHTKDSKGACSPWLPCEYDYNLQVANELKKLNPDLYDVYTHNSYSGGYYAMEQRTASVINKKNYDLVLELHYNSATPTAHGTECCFWFASTKGREYAQQIANGISNSFSTRNRGLKPLKNKNDRGYWFTYLMKDPAVIIEPFFGSNEKEALKFKDIKNYASVLHSIFTRL